MDARAHLKMGLEGLSVHRLRTMLTMLGIIFGVAAVIAMLSIGEGAKLAALEKFKVLGVNNIIIRDKGLSDKDLEEVRAKFSRGLSIRDADAIKKIIPTVEAVSAQAEMEVEAVHADRSEKVMLVGVSPTYSDILNFVPTSGTFLTETHHRLNMRVCVLGADVARSLFPIGDPVGKPVKLGDQWFDVVGTMRSKALFTETVGELAARNLNQDIYVPLSSMLRRFSKKNALASEVDQLTVKVRDSSQLVETATVIRRILNRRHHGNADYNVVVPYELLKHEEKERRIYNMVLGSIAAISLLVGGIGIMNIMLATVLERTREIGTRRAVGAKQKDIMVQFLVEAVVLSLAGGLVGVVAGVAMSLIIGVFAEFDTVISPVWVCLSFGLSGAVGVISGTFPAKRAASISPIEALHYE